jgi:hypothetical protein
MDENHTSSASPPPDVGSASGNPWERRDSLGFGTAFVENLKLFITSPGEAFAQTRKQGDFASPLIFAVIVGWLGAVIGQLWGMLIGSSVLSVLPAELGDTAGVFMATSVGGLFLSLILAPFYITVGLVIISALLHLCLVMVGGLGTSEAGFEGTFRVVSYASVAQLAQLVPAVGGMITAIWTLVLVVIGFTRLHGTEQGKAVTAVLIPVGVCCVCVVIGLMVAGASLLTLFAGQQ